VIEFLKTKLPEGTNGMMDGAISGGEGGGSDLMEKAKGLVGGFF
jgi:hypothetical protein